MTENCFTPDRQRRERLGFDEAVFCESKSRSAIEAILAGAADLGDSLLLTRLDGNRFKELRQPIREALDYDPDSRTAFFGSLPETPDAIRVGVVSAGTSDYRVAREAVRVLRYYGECALEVYDVGVAGLWRLLERTEELATLPVVIAVAGMDAALPSVLGGLIPGSVIAVPTSVGYGVAQGGGTALQSALASCAPGVTVVNIDNGFGAACAALRVVKPALRSLAGSKQS